MVGLRQRLEMSIRWRNIPTVGSLEEQGSVTQQGRTDVVRSILVRSRGNLHTLHRALSLSVGAPYALGTTCFSNIAPLLLISFKSMCLQ
ncbi:hypothetical protein HBI56_222780 [Parastagonospora nodorum]|nr:hypothetical protein HBH56_148190 [Parastagonospora nodorum]KAH3923287.1 hypothetical protein HBH54_212830 [Parastagonospora nodorum]KAH3945944.1 hypothetical protein HBH53_135650 [Parastagonospora nodorum]KAH3984018.1 hypothetical protein HBH52_064370 [Parastagonospora nodorum]KAH3985507.1 hypothetical protein HBH51_023140 [Parastagonospora nodorum]